MLLIFLTILLTLSFGPYIYNLATKEYIDYKKGKITKTDTPSNITVLVEKNRIYKLIAKGNGTKGYYKFTWEFKKK